MSETEFVELLGGPLDGCEWVLFDGSSELRFACMAGGKVPVWLPEEYSNHFEVARIGTYTRVEGEHYFRWAE